MMREYHVQFCERLRVKFPLPTRPEKHPVYKYHYFDSLKNATL